MLVNICCPYTSRDDITQAVRSLAGQAQEGRLNPAKVDVSTFAGSLYTGQSPPLDVLVRTSGATRLSDFMLWESNMDARVEFVDALWPDLGARDMYRLILKYSYATTKKLKYVCSSITRPKKQYKKLKLTAGSPRRARACDRLRFPLEYLCPSILGL